MKKQWKLFDKQNQQVTTTMTLKQYIDNINQRYNAKTFGTYEILSPSPYSNKRILPEKRNKANRLSNAKAV
jgi:hypothetical protein